MPAGKPKAGKPPGDMAARKSRREERAQAAAERMRRQSAAVERVGALRVAEKLADEAKREAAQEGGAETPLPEVADRRMAAYELIYGLTRAFRPERVFLAMPPRGPLLWLVARALRAGGRGRLFLAERRHWMLAGVQQELKEQGLDAVAQVLTPGMLNAAEPFDMAIFGAAPGQQEEDFFHYRTYLKEGALVCIPRLAPSRERAPFGTPAERLVRWGCFSESLTAPGQRMFAGRLAAQIPVPREKRIVLTVTAGRSGTAYLQQLLAGLPDMVCFHEPYPNFASVSAAARSDPQAARRFVETVKLPFIRSLPGAAYVETSHFAAKGFLESFIELGAKPDLIFLRRAPRKVASSWYAIGSDPLTGGHMLSPPQELEGWEYWHPYQRCYWYALEMERRMGEYERRLKEYGGRGITLSLEGLSQGDDLPRLLEWLEVPADIRAHEVFAYRRAREVNAKRENKDPALVAELRGLDLDALEKEVRARLV